MKIKPYRVVVNYLHSRCVHKEFTSFNVEAIDYGSAIEKAKKCFKKYCRPGCKITSTFIYDR